MLFPLKDNVQHLNCVIYKGILSHENKKALNPFYHFSIWWNGLKACVWYFLSIFYFSPNGSPSKTMKNAFYFIKKALFVLEIFVFLPLFSPQSAIALEVDWRNVKVYNVINCLNENLITHFVWCLEKEKLCLLIDY